MNIDLFIKYCKVLSECANNQFTHKIDDNLRIEYGDTTVNLLNLNKIESKLGTDSDTFRITVCVETSDFGIYDSPCIYIFDEDQIILSCDNNEIHSIDSKDDLFNLNLQYENLTFTYDDLLKIQEANRKHNFKINMFFTVGEEEYASNC
ncbi:hypothetical protein XaC1_218 [Xanthomonas phage XaC1]|nr:hypothetical protein XaC1_218 [Xanthomonas phage XaC1]